HDDIDAAENYHHVGDGVAQTHVFEDSQVDKTWRAYPITIRIRSAVADQIKSELAFRRFDAAVCFANWRPERPGLHFRIQDRPGLNLGERLFQNFDALAHLQRAHHQSIICVTVLA